MSDTPEAQTPDATPEAAPATEALEEAATENLNLQDLGEPNSGAAGGEAGLDAVYDVPVTVKAVLGTTDMRISQLLKLGRGAIVDLDRRVGDAIDIYVNDRLVARGEVVIVDDKLGVTMTEIVKSSQG